jgi:hypothetical protein
MEAGCRMVSSGTRRKKRSERHQTSQKGMIPSVPFLTISVARSCEERLQQQAPAKSSVDLPGSHDSLEFVALF